MSRANDNAFPVPGMQTDPDFNGLSVREYFAAMALTGICMEANGETYSPDGAAARAVNMADALLARLAKAAP